MKKNHNRTYNKVADALMDGDYEWMYSDIYGDISPFWNRGDETETDEIDSAIDASAEEPVPVPK